MATAASFNIGDDEVDGTSDRNSDDNQPKTQRRTWHYVVLSVALLAAACLATYQAYYYERPKHVDHHAMVTNAFDINRAKEMANLASIAYCKSTTVQGWACSSCQPGQMESVLACPSRQFHFAIKEPKTTWSKPILVRHVFVGKYRGQGAVFVQGEVEGWKHLQNLSTAFWDGNLSRGKDWRYGFSWLTESCHGCKIGEEFAAEHFYLRDCIMNSLKKIGVPPGESISIVGHGKGGAEALMAALDLRHHGYHIKELYTFGSPRVGDARFANYVRHSLMGSFWRLTNARDPFTNLPQREKGFVHPSPEVFFPSDDVESFRICSSVEDSSCSMGFKNRASNELYEAKHWQYLGYKMGHGAAASCGDADLANDFGSVGTQDPDEPTLASAESE